MHPNFYCKKYFFRYKIGHPIISTAYQWVEQLQNFDTSYIFSVFIKLSFILSRYITIMKACQLKEKYNTAPTLRSLQLATIKRISFYKMYPLLNLRSKKLKKKMENNDQSPTQHLQEFSLEKKSSSMKFRRSCVLLNAVK